MNENKKYRFYGLLLYYVLRLLFSTLKVKIVNKNNLDINKQYIYCFWHSKLVLPSMFFRKIGKKVALSSPTKDGELISVPLEKLGYTLVRGSSDKKSVGSVINLLKYLKKGYSMGTPLDGPKGPEKKVKKGMLYLAQKSGIELIPIGVAYKKKWIFKKTWDKFEMPKPFSDICILFGDKIKISKDEDIEKTVDIMELKINEMNKLAEDFLEGRYE